jgi:hypothetical protein
MQLHAAFTMIVLQLVLTDVMLAIIIVERKTSQGIHTERFPIPVDPSITHV